VKRKEYDERERPDQKKKNLLVQKEFDEVFANNAYDDRDGESKGKDTDDDDDDDDDDKPVSEAKQKIIAEMKEHVIAILTSGTSDDIKKLKQLGQKLIDQNKSDKVFATDRQPPVTYIKKTGIKYRELLDIARSTVRTQEDAKKIRDAESALTSLKEQVREFMEDLKLPIDWTFPLPEARQDLSPQGASNTARPSQGSQPDRSSRPQGQGLSPQGASNTARPSQGSQPDRSSRPQGQEASPEPMDIDSEPTGVNVKWEAGQTTGGDAILGYRPIVKEFQEMGTQRYVKTESISHYVIEKKNQANPIELVGAGQIGEDAIKAFLALPEERKASLSLTNIAQGYRRRHGPSITEVIGYARSPDLTPAGRFPLSFFLIMFDGERRLVNRTALRNAKGAKYADDMIAAFLKKIGEPPEESKADRLALTAHNADHRRTVEEMRQQRPLGGRVAPNATISGASRSFPVTNMRSLQSPTNDYVTADMLEAVMKETMDGFLKQMTELMKNMQVAPAR
jgi:hypothetical protein